MITWPDAIFGIVVVVCGTIICLARMTSLVKLAGDIVEEHKHEDQAKKE